jgi:outer membrane protein assembly complex protein YaeT
LVVTLVSLGCHEEGSISVKDLTFTGVRAFSVSTLKSVLATRESGWLPWARKHYFDRAEFDADLQRVHAFYADRGYPAQRVAGVHVDVSPDRASVRIRIDIDEGPPVRVEEVRFQGFDVLPDEARAPILNAPLRAGMPRDRDLVRSTRDVATGLLHDRGYPTGYVDAGERPGLTAGHVIVTFRAMPGPEMRFGDVTVDGLEDVDASLVTRAVSFAPGDLYRESQVRRTQRRLSSLELFNLVTVTPRLDDSERAEGAHVPVRITLAEAKPRRLKFGVGYGTEDRARASVNWQHLNFLGGARRAELDAHASSLDRRIRVSLVQPRLRRQAWSFTVSALAATTRQLSYESESYGGRATLIFRTDTNADRSRRPVRYELRTGYAHEYLRYGIRADSLGDLTRREERIALGLDPDTGRGVGTLGAIQVDLERTAVDDPVLPRRGTIATLHVEHAAPWLAGTYRFDEVLADARGYHPVFGSVLAVRAMFGAVAARDPSRVPFSKRYFLGGATSLRGWGRYQVSPIDDTGLPIGGRTLAEMSTELRFPIRGKISGVAFIDAGSVGASDWAVERLKLRMNVGPGLRYETPIGALRADVGWQMTPIEGLRVNGQTTLRPWRLHLSIGQAF